MRSKIGSGVGVLLAFVQCRHGGIKQVSHGQDREPGGERVREELMDPLEVACECNINLHAHVHGDRTSNILALLGKS